MVCFKNRKTMKKRWLAARPGFAVIYLVEPTVVTCKVEAQG